MPVVDGLLTSLDTVGNSESGEGMLTVSTSILSENVMFGVGGVFGHDAVENKCEKGRRKV